MFGLKQNQKAYPLSIYKRHVLELSINDGLGSLREGRPFLSPKETVLVVKPVLSSYQMHQGSVLAKEVHAFLTNDMIAHETETKALLKISDISKITRIKSKHKPFSMSTQGKVTEP